MLEGRPAQNGEYMAVACMRSAVAFWEPSSPSQRYAESAEALLATFSSTDAQMCARRTSNLTFGPSLSSSGHAQVCDAAFERLRIFLCSVLVMQAP